MQSIISPHSIIVVSWLLYIVQGAKLQITRWQGDIQIQTKRRLLKTIVAITADFSHICSEMETHVFRKSEYYQETADPSGMAGTVIHPSECTILFCVSGYALVSVNFVRRVVRRGDIVVVLSDTLLSVDAVSQTFRAKRIEVAANLLDEATFSLSSDFFDRIYDNPIFPTTGEQRTLWEAWYGLNDYCMSIDEYKPAYIMLCNQLQNLFLAMEAATKPAVPTRDIKPVSQTRRLFNSFCRPLAARRRVLCRQTVRHAVLPLEGHFQDLGYIAQGVDR